MAKDPDVPDSTGDEYEYDLAHDETTGPNTEAPTPAPQLPPSMHVTDNDGDYGYDSAHDMS
jgi:hypothetical protein